jgi:hypothetical protein
MIDELIANAPKLLRHGDQKDGASGWLEHWNLLGYQPITVASQSSSRIRLLTNWC